MHLFKRRIGNKILNLNCMFPNQIHFKINSETVKRSYNAKTEINGCRSRSNDDV